MNYCVYCGSEAECLDHVIPVSFLSEKRSYDTSKFWLENACTICNTLAGSNVFFSIPEKAKFIIERIKVKYKKVIRVPAWSQDELEDLDYKLRELVWANITARQVLKVKLSHLEHVSSLPASYRRPQFMEKLVNRWLEQAKLELKPVKKKIRNYRRKKAKNLRTSVKST